MSDQVWIRTEPDLDGVYRVVLEVDDDNAYPLDEKAALQYASEILRSVAIAGYDAAVIAQMTQAGGGADNAQEVAVQLVSELRADRPPAARATPLSLLPGVSAFTGKPFLHVQINGRTVGEWSSEAARRHALAVLEAVHVAELDSGYLRALRSLINLDEPTARAVVEDLVNHRA